MKKREESTVKNIEMLAELKRVEPMFDKLSDVAHEIVERTFDSQCCSIEDLIVGDTTVEVQYEYRCRGEYGHDYVNVPIEWFDEGFDYEAAYREMRQKELEVEQKKLEAEQKRKAAAKRKAAVKRANKEFETYLKLKQKYEAAEEKSK